MEQLGILFVGGGNATVTLLKLFATDENVKVLGVADPNPLAPGILYAQKARIKTSKNFEELISNSRVEVIVEVTGSAKVRSRITELLNPNQQVMNAAAAKILVEQVDRQSLEQQKVVEVSNNINQQIDNTAEDIGRVLREMKILAINANVEAARLGNEGKSFAIVADRMSELTIDVQKAINNITMASRKNKEFLRNYK